MKNKQQTIVIGITSGIAAFKVVDLVSALREKGFAVIVIMTEHATSMISPDLLVKATGNKVYTTLFEKGFDYHEVLEKKEVDHITLAIQAELFVIAPATANIIGKLAHGIADDFLTTTILATKAPILLCPSMNTNMWNNSAVVENVKILKQRNYIIIEPDSGELACGMKGVGRLTNIDTITSKISRIFNFRKRLSGKRIIVTAGGTSEPIDAVRVVTNRSSGKMGVALAEECYFQGAEVLLIRARTSVTTQYPIKQEVFETAGDLSVLIKKYVANYDVIFHAAAVSDFVPEKFQDKKIDSRVPLTIHFAPAEKIIKQIKIWNPKILLIGFKAIYKEPEKKLIRKGIGKIKENNADYLIINDVGQVGIGFGVDDNEVYILSKKEIYVKIPKASKHEVARSILDSVF